MRKTIAILLTLMTLLAAGCGSSKPSETPDESQAPAFASAVELYTQIWDTLGEDRQFPAAGGDAEHEAEAPAKFALTKENKETFEYLLHVTDELYDMLDDDAATLQHMMNTNTFSSAAVKLKDPSAAEEFAEAYKTGRGKIKIKARVNIEKDTGDKQNLVISELPYQVNKAELLKKIAELTEEKKDILGDIADVVDESD